MPNQYEWLGERLAEIHDQQQREIRGDLAEIDRKLKALDRRLAALDKTLREAK